MISITENTRKVMGEVGKNTDGFLEKKIRE